MNPIDAYARDVVDGRILAGKVAIYALVDERVTDPVRRVRYIGQTVKPLARRLAIHWQTSRAGHREHRAAWMRRMEADGALIGIELLAVVDADLANAAECAAIVEWRSRGADLTNTTIGGEGVRGLTPSRETRRKMSESAKRRVVATETRRKAQASLKARYTDPVLRARMREIVAGRTRSPETRRKMSAARRGEGNGMSRLTWEAVSAIRARYAAGAKQADIVREFGVPAPTVCMVVNGKTWKAA